MLQVYNLSNIRNIFAKKENTKIKTFGLFNKRRSRSKIITYLRQVGRVVDTHSDWDPTHPYNNFEQNFAMEKFNSN